MNAPQSLESDIAAAGANVAPRVTPADIEAAIASEHYFTAADGDAQAMQNAAFVNGALDGEQMRPVPEPLGLLTFCVLVLNNGFTVTGESYCFNPDNFDSLTGKQEARMAAVNKVWELKAYQLREQLYQRTQPAAAPDDNVLPSYQQRVVAEKAELDNKLDKLRAFAQTSVFHNLPDAEKQRMAEQTLHMQRYSTVLAQRIAAFA